MYGTKTYKSWAEMNYRCKKVGTKHYNDRGITVCERWKKFESFFEDMGIYPENKSIDRIDVNGNYCKENCRWATNTEQARNKTNTMLVKGKTLSEWGEILNIKRSTLSQRYYVYQWSVEKVLSPKKIMVTKK